MATFKFYCNAQLGKGAYKKTEITRTILRRHTILKSNMHPEITKRCLSINKELLRKIFEIQM